MSRNRPKRTSTYYFIIFNLFILLCSRKLMVKCFEMMGKDLNKDYLGYVMMLGLDVSKFISSGMSLHTRPNKTLNNSQPRRKSTDWSPTDQRPASKD